MEREPIPQERIIKAAASAVLHRFARIVAEIPLELRILRAPEGELVRDGEVTATGKVVRYSGDSYVIASGGKMIFPNPLAGDVIRKVVA